MTSLGVSQNKTILITGAGGTLGSRIAHQVAEPNTHLILLDRKASLLEKTALMLDPLSPKMTLVPLDLEFPETLEQLAKPLLEKISHLDHIYVCHGFMHSLKPTETISPQEWYKSLTLNLTSNFFLIRLVLPFLRKAPSATLNFFSCSITNGYDAGYASSKSALKALVSTLQNEQASSKVSINFIEEPPFDSPLRRIAFPNGDPKTLKSKTDVEA